MKKQSRRKSSGIPTGSEDVPDMWRVTLVGMGIFVCWLLAALLKVKGLLP